MEASSERRAKGRRREPDSRYRALVEMTGMGYISLTVEGTVLDANAEYARLTGHRRPEELLGKNVIEWTAERDKARFRRELAKCLQKRAVRDIEVCCTTPEGNELPVELNAVVVDDEGSRVILALCRDASDGRREENLRATLESTADGILAVDDKGKLVFVNSQFVQMWHIPPRLVERGRDEELLSFVLSQLCDPEGFLARVRELYHSVREGFDVLHFLDGRIFERYSRPLLRGDRLAGRVWSFRDATERRAAAAALEASEARYRIVTDLMSDYVFKLDVSEDGSVLMDMVTDNFQSITGRTVEEAKTPDLWSKIVHPDDLPAVLNLLSSLVSKDGAAELDCRSYVHGGRMRWVHVVARAVTNQKTGRTAAIVGAVKDITERKLAEEERLRLEAHMLQAQKLESLGILAGGIAHDFNNILMAIIGNADLALLDMPENLPARGLLQDIDKAAHRAADLCRHMLAYSGKGRFDVKRLDLSDLVRDMTQILEVSISKKVTLACELPEGLPLMEADAGQIRQVVMNLIINASEAMEDKNGSVKVRTSVIDYGPEFPKGKHFHGELQPGPHLVLEVSDSGLGMDSATLDRMFDPFFTTKFTGRGLGLAAVLGIVRGHHAALQVQSKPGKGTTFRIFFPTLASVARAVDKKPAKVAEWKGEGAVLLVDDEFYVRTAARRMLERLGFEVLEAHDGLQALEVFRKEGKRIKCTLLDLTMPVMDGEQTFRELRRIDPNTPVVISSGYSEQEVVNRFAKQGINGFIYKPYQMQNLSATLKSVLGEKKK